MKPLYFLSFIFFLSCADTKKLDDHLVFKRADQIDHYQLVISDKQLGEIFREENISMEERRLAEIIHHQDPVSIADSVFVAEMDATPYFTKRTLHSKHNEKILNAFLPEETVFSASFSPAERLCVPTYRDILVFRHKGGITGFAKLCFDCNDAHVVGQTNPEGLQPDYETLRKTLSETGEKTL